MSPKIDVEVKGTMIWDAALVEVALGAACVPLIVKIGLVVATKLSTSVVAAHQKPGEINGVWHLQRTKEYLKKFGGLIESGQVKDAKELSAAMMKAYPDRLNSGALIVSSRAAFPKPNRL